MPDYSDTRIQVRRGTTTQFSTANTTLGAGEPAFDTTKNFIKVGDGTTSWNNLPNHVVSKTTNIPDSSGVHNLVFITQENYNALATKDEHTLYFIPE